MTLTSKVKLLPGPEKVLTWNIAMLWHNITWHNSREINLAFSQLRSVSLPWNFSGKCKVIRLGKHLFSWHRMTHLLRLLPALVLHIDVFGWRPGHFQSSTSIITCGDVVYARETTFVSVALFSPDNKLQIFFFLLSFLIFHQRMKNKIIQKHQSLTALNHIPFKTRLSSCDSSWCVVIVQMTLRISFCWFCQFFISCVLYVWVFFFFSYFSGEYRGWFCLLPRCTLR